MVSFLHQMTILLAQFSLVHEKHPFYRIADICMALNFTLNPVVYVLSRRPHRRGLRELLKPFCQSCWSGQSSRKSSTLRSSQCILQTPDIISKWNKFKGLSSFHLVTLSMTISRYHR